MLPVDQLKGDFASDSNPCLVCDCRERGAELKRNAQHLGISGAACHHNPVEALAVAVRIEGGLLLDKTAFELAGHSRSKWNTILDVRVAQAVSMTACLASHQFQPPSSVFLLASAVHPSVPERHKKHRKIMEIIWNSWGQDDYKIAYKPTFEPITGLRHYSGWIRLVFLCRFMSSIRFLAL